MISAVVAASSPADGRTSWFGPTGLFGGVFGRAFSGGLVEKDLRRIGRGIGRGIIRIAEGRRKSVRGGILGVEVVVVGLW